MILRFQQRPGCPIFSRHALRRFGCLALAWFALSLGVAIAAPCVHPVSMQLVCSGTGPVKVVVNVDGGVHEMGADQMDCAMCVPAGAPPPVMLTPTSPPALQPLGRVVQAIPAARLAALVAAPLPPRGPPALV